MIYDLYIHVRTQHRIPIKTHGSDHRWPDARYGLDDLWYSMFDVWGVLRNGELCEYV